MRVVIFFLDYSFTKQMNDFIINPQCLPLGCYVNACVGSKTGRLLFVTYCIDFLAQIELRLHCISHFQI